MVDPGRISLRAQPLTSERFAAYGDVIEGVLDSANAMNEARFQRFDDLCKVDLGGGDVSISIARCRAPTALPLCVDMVERHPLGSQAFVPLKPCRMLVVVAPPGESVAVEDLRAFVTNGRQGINYHRGTWHMPLIAFDAGQDFLIVDRGGSETNCDMHTLDQGVMLEAV